VTEHPSIFFDVMPTLAEVAGIEIPEQTDGISFLPELLGGKQRKHDHLYWELQLASGSPKGFRQAVRVGEWKAVRYTQTKRTELYNLNTDPYETTDLAVPNSEIVAQMNRILATESVKNEHYPYSIGPGEDRPVPLLKETARTAFERSSGGGR
jgi:arylsulfatase A-like enzyme